MYEIKDVIWPNIKSPFLQPVSMGTSIYLVLQVKAVVQLIFMIPTKKDQIHSTLDKIKKGYIKSS